MDNLGGTLDQPCNNTDAIRYTYTKQDWGGYQTHYSSSPKNIMPKISSIDDTIHAAQDLVFVLQYPSPVVPLVTLVNAHKEALISLAALILKATYLAEPLRVPI